MSRNKEAEQIIATQMRKMTYAEFVAFADSINDHTNEMDLEPALDAWAKGVLAPEEDAI